MKRPLNLLLVGLCWFLVPWSIAHSTQQDRHSLAFTLQATAQKLQKRLPTYYPEIKRVAADILQHWDARDTILISLGRGPSIFTTYLKIFKLNREQRAHLLELPFSNYPRFHGLPFQDLDTLDTAEKAFLRTYFYRFVVPSMSPQIKKILVLDYAHSGLSLFTFTAVLRNFFATEFPHLAPQLSWEVLAVTTAPPTTGFKGLAERSNLPPAKIVHLTRTSPLARQLVWHYFDQFAPFKEYPVDEYIRWMALTSSAPHQGILAQKELAFSGAPLPLPNQDFYAILVNELKRIAAKDCAANLQKLD